MGWRFNDQCYPDESSAQLGFAGNYPSISGSTVTQARAISVDTSGLATWQISTNGGVWAARSVQLTSCTPGTIEVQEAAVGVLVACLFLVLFSLGFLASR